MLKKNYFLKKDSIYSITIKSFITLSTVPLIILIIVYNSIQIKVSTIFLYANFSSLN